MNILSNLVLSNELVNNYSEDGNINFKEFDDSDMKYFEDSISEFEESFHEANEDNVYKIVNLYEDEIHTVFEIKKDFTAYRYMEYGGIHAIKIDDVMYNLSTVTPMEEHSTEEHDYLDIFEHVDVYNEVRQNYKPDEILF